MKNVGNLHFFIVTGGNNSHANKNPYLLYFTISEFISVGSHAIIFTKSERGIHMYFSNDTHLYQIIGTNIKHYREEAKLTQVQLAEQAKISISYLSKIEAAS